MFTVARRCQILLISESLRASSTNTAVLQTARAVGSDAISTVLYGRMGALPHFNPDDDREGEPVHPAVGDLRRAVRAADALLVCTPEYAGALPGSFKNLLEWTVGDASTYERPVAWINASGPAAPKGGADAHESLGKVLRYVGADVVEAACVRIPLTRDLVASDGAIADPAIRARIAEPLRALARHVADPENDGTE